MAGSSQLVDATDRLNTSDGFNQPSVCRGRLLSCRATALRPRLRASSITSRCGSQALAAGDRPTLIGPGSVDTSPEMAGFEARLGGRPRPRTRIPAAFRYRLAVSRRTEVTASIRLKDQPSRPRLSTSCFLCSLKTLLIQAQKHDYYAFVNVSAGPC